MHQEFRECLQRLLPQALTLQQKPFLECRLGHGEAREQIAPVQLGGLLECRHRALGDAALEPDHVDLHGGRVEGDVISLCQEQRQ